MPEQYLALRRSAACYLASDLSKATARQQAALAKLARWPTANETDIARGLVESRWPVTGGAVEPMVRGQPQRGRTAFAMTAARNWSPDRIGGAALRSRAFALNSFTV